ncbi:MAG TPA: hydrogenase 4 subunit B [Patescibacteria group bacterium]|nr:hydrogenase 4 subunit B [Patescibacteria group bacterium]
MLDSIASTSGFIALLSLFGLGMAGCLLGAKNDKFANIWGNICAICGSLWGLTFASSMLITGNELAMKAQVSNFSSFSLALHIDKLAAFFLFVISLIALFCSVYGIGYVREYYKRYSIGLLGFLYSAFIVGMLLVVTASNGIFFLVAWEIMSLASYFLVVYDRNEPQNVRAGYIYLIMTHVGAVCILLAMLILQHYTHSFDFAAIAAGIHLLPASALAAVFVLAFIGLGTKAGVIPLHIWLPSAHPAAPSHVSALMSGVMIKTGIYMMIRLFLDVLQPIPTWWGVVVLVMGGISAVLGVLYALTEHDLKRLLAYHSIENIGIILLGLGGAMIFSSLHRPELVLLALAAALFHTLNHAVFKSLLFLSAGSVIQATHTRNIEKYGGLIKLMPLAALFFLVGSMAISALPPFNGFFSEWLTYQSLFNGFAAGGEKITWIFVFGAASLAITGGLALACFVKAFGTAFLARPRSDAAKHAKESSWPMWVGMGGLALLCLAIGLGSAPVASALTNISRQVTGIAGPSAATAGAKTIAVNNGASSVSGLAALALILLATASVWFVAKYVINRRQKVVVGETWDCGTPLTGRMEITASGFARSIHIMFKALLRPSLHHQVEYHNPVNPYSVKSRKVSMAVHDIYYSHLYLPAYRALIACSRFTKRIQNGNLNTYVLYIFGILILALLVRA